MKITKIAVSVLLTVIIILTVSPIKTASVAEYGRVVAFSVEDVTIVEGQGSVSCENGEYKCHYFIPIHYDVLLDDGDSMSGDSSIVEFDGEEHYIVIRGETQDQIEWTAGNTYRLVATLEDETCEFHVTIVKGPAVSLECQNIVLIEGTNGRFEWDDEGNEYYHYDIDLEYEATLSDGTKVKKGQPYYFNGEQAGIWYSDDQHANHYEAGHTYTGYASYLGAYATYNVTIVSCPVKSVSAQNMSLVVGTEGDMQVDGNDNLYYHYDPVIPFTVTLLNDTVVNCPYGYFNFGGKRYYSHLISDQYYNHWTPGNTYNASIEFLGAFGELDITITESPIVKIECEDLHLLEKYDSYTDTDYNGIEYQHYNVAPGFKVTLADGREIYGGGYSVYIDGKNYPIEYYDTQEYVHWTGGNTEPYIVGASVPGATCEFKVYVDSAPFKKLEILDTFVIEGVDGYDSSYEGFFRYYYSPDFRLTMNDDTVLESRYGGLEYKKHYISVDILDDDQFVDHWEVGEVHGMTGRVFGMTDQFSVSVLPSPVKSVDFEDMTIFEGLEGYDQYDYETSTYYRNYELMAMRYKIYYNDGTSDVSGKYADVNWNGRDYYARAVSPNNTKDWAVGGSYTVTASVIGKEGTFTASVVPNPYTSVTISTAPTGEGDAYYIRSAYTGVGDDNGFRGYLVSTDGHAFNCSIIYPGAVSGEYEFDDPFYITVGGMKSNTLSGCTFFKDFFNDSSSSGGQLVLNFSNGSQTGEEHTVYCDGVSIGKFGPGEEVNLPVPAMRNDDGEYLRFYTWLGEDIARSEFNTSNGTANGRKYTLTMPARDVYLTSDFVLIGDANGDNKITSRDSSQIKKFLAEAVVLEGKQLEAADLDCNGKVNSRDSGNLRKLIAESYVPTK
ncbi:MAG: dockerin type I repeat-containing protein [Clostridia bacterium]|nr:dockerin type I repeat-containing protein [Clostridia bacterium]